MKVSRLLFFSALIFLFVGTSMLRGQSLSEDWLSPRATQPDPGCGKLVSLADESWPCGFAADSFFIIGKGTTTTITVVNPALKNVKISFGFNCPAGIDGPNYGNCPLYESSFGGTPMVAYGIFSTRPPMIPLNISLLYAADSTGSFPLPNDLQFGTITMVVFGPDEKTLDAQLAYVVIRSAGTGEGNQFSEINVPFVRELDATALRTLPLPRSLSATASAIAVQNPSATPQAVKVSLSLNGSMTTFITPVLGPDASFQGSFEEMFGVPLNAETLPGDITFEGLAGEPIISAILEPSIVTAPIRYRPGDPSPRGPVR